jgi:hypothetical protein
VVAWLTGKGVSASRLTPQGFGDTKPVAPNTGEEGRAKKPARRAGQALASRVSDQEAGAQSRIRPSASATAT